MNCSKTTSNSTTPNNIIELDLVHDMVAARWRLQRTRSLETVTLNQRMVDREADKLKREPDFPRSTRLAYAVSYSGELRQVAGHPAAL